MIGTIETAKRLGVGHHTIQRFASHWYRPGHGTAVGLTDVDVMVCRAWVAINDRRSWAPDHQTRSLLKLAERAIRTSPQRWLLISGSHAETFSGDDGTAAVRVWIDNHAPGDMGWLIDIGEPRG